MGIVLDFLVVGLAEPAPEDGVGEADLVADAFGGGDIGVLEVGGAPGEGPGVEGDDEDGLLTRTTSHVFEARDTEMQFCLCLELVWTRGDSGQGILQEPIVVDFVLELAVLSTSILGFRMVLGCWI